MKKLIVLAGLLFTAVVSSAAPVTIYFVGFHPPGWQAGYPYYATVNGGQQIEVMCDDWAHGGMPGQTWEANVTDLGTGNLSTLRFNQLPNALTLYDEAGWLLLETQVTPSTQWTDINIAVWYTFDHSTPLTTGALAWLAAAQQEANNGFQGVNFHRVAIYTPVAQYDQNAEGPQELMAIVPEPSALVMMAGGLFVLAGRRKRF